MYSQKKRYIPFIQHPKFLFFSTRLDSRVKSDAARVQSYLHLSTSRQRYSAAPRDLWSHSARSIHFARNRLEPRGRSSRTGNGVNFHGSGKFINPLCILPSGWNPVASRRNPSSTWSYFPRVASSCNALSSASSLRRVARRRCHFSHEFRRHTWIS